MSKTEILSEVTEKLGDMAQQAGVVAMTAAAVLSVVQPGDHSSRVVVPKTVSFAPAWETQENNPVRREKEEAAPHFVSYSEVQRTPGRSRRIA